MGLRSRSLKTELEKHTDLTVGLLVCEYISEHLDKYLEVIIKLAEENARRDGRTSILPRDIDFAVDRLGGALIDNYRGKIQK